MDFPNPATGLKFKYPVTRSFSFNTIKNRFLDDTEQRWSTRKRIEKFVLQYQNISLADLNTLKAFFEDPAVRGMYGRDWNLPFDGTTYTNCSFDTDAFAFRETMPNLYSLELPIRQVVPFTVNTPRPDPADPSFAAYPTLLGNIRFQRPYTAADRFLTVVEDSELSGFRYSDWVRSTPLGYWELNYPCIRPADANTLALFFIWHEGRLCDFSFVDPLGVSHSKCRFASDTMTFRYEGINHFSTSVAIEEIK